jgi:hypothetical protein
MIISANLLFSDDQAITATAVSTNVIDLGARDTPFRAAAALNGDIGKGEPVPILIQITEAFNNLTSLTITLETGPNADMSSSTVLETQTILLAALTKGKQANMRFLPNGVTGRYLGVRYTVSGTAPTTGKVFSAITAGVQTNFTGG